ncbi:hypothetical protein DFJ73DRAFT_795906 [Zopfochytrium polystomum]|nr:hypothetical protein DFJ73DRAFT_795906 [Zopfochytrium polystomum]
MPSEEEGETATALATATAASSPNRAAAAPAAAATMASPSSSSPVLTFPPPPPPPPAPLEPVPPVAVAATPSPTPAPPIIATPTPVVSQALLRAPTWASSNTSYSSASSDSSSDSLLSVPPGPLFILTTPSGGPAAVLNPNPNTSTSTASPASAQHSADSTMTLCLANAFRGEPAAIAPPSARPTLLVPMSMPTRSASTPSVSSFVSTPVTASDETNISVSLHEDPHDEGVTRLVKDPEDDITATAVNATVHHTPDTHFGVTKETIQDMMDSRSVDALNGLGGISGLLKRLRTNVYSGLTPERELASSGKWWTLPSGMDSSENAHRHGGPRKIGSAATMKSLTNTDGADVFSERRKVFDDNVLPQPELKSIWSFAADALKDKTLIILCFAAVAEIGTGVYKAAFAPEREPAGYVDGITIVLAVLAIVMISSYNDYRKQGQFRALSDYSRSLSKFQVIRNGRNTQVPTSTLLVGDICSVSVGDILPADGVLVQSFNLSCDESSLTGEGITIAKDLKKDPFLLSGTKVVNGMGRMVVVATGKNSINGRLLAALDVEEEETPLQSKLAKLADRISLFGLASAIIMVVVLAIIYFVIQPETPRSSFTVVSDMIGLFIVGITLVVVAVPEGLPLAVVLALAHATLRMLKDNNLVRHLKACETMGNATTVCSDKTGTLTQNKMSVIVGWVSSHQFGKLPQEFDVAAAASEMTVSTSNDATMFGGSAAILARAAADVAQEGKAPTPEPAWTGRVPESVLNLIACSINLNSTAEEVHSESDASSVKPDESGAKGSLPWWKRLFSKSKPVATASDEEAADAQESKPQFIGSKTEVALLEFTNRELRRPYREDREANEIAMVLPFSSERKRMSTIIRVPNRERIGEVENALFGTPAGLGRGEKHWLFCKGAAEIVLKSCDSYLDSDGKAVPLTPEARANFEECITAMASSALRTICVAFKPFRGSISALGKTSNQKLAEQSESSADGRKGSTSLSPPPTITISSEVAGAEADSQEPDEHGLIVAAIVGIQDPIRPEVPGAIADCARAGIVVRMVTGDNMATASSIARQAGILPANDSTLVAMEGPEFRKLSEPEMDKILPKLRVLARSSPLDKQVLVQGLKRLGETVAVTGDGTNDAPALRAADVGFSMGIAGTEVAKEASDIVLLDDNFVSLSKAILWGRSVYDSVRKFLQFQLTVNVVAVLLTMVSAFITATLSPSKKPQSVLTAIQLLWVNLIMDTFAALALATDPPTPELLDRPPARRTDPLISGHMWRMIVGQSFYQFVACMLIYLGYSGILKNGRIVDDEPLGVSMETATVVFNAFVFCQIFNEINCRVIGRDLNVFKNITKNNYFIAICIGTIITQIIIVEFGGDAFKTEKLDIVDWLICIGVGLMSFPIAAVIRLLPSFGLSSRHTTYHGDSPSKSGSALQGNHADIDVIEVDGKLKMNLSAVASASSSSSSAAAATGAAAGSGTADYEQGASSAPPAREVIVKPEQELRLEVGVKETVTLKVKSGRAEIFGTELAENAEYSFSGAKLAVFTWDGCVVELKGQCDDYVAGDTPMQSYLNVHIALERIREEASSSGAVGPTVMIVGPTDCGKSSLCKTLINYAVKCERKPVFVDLDTNEGSLAMPGSLAATVYLRNIDVEEEFGGSPQSTGATPLVFYYGYSAPTERPKLYSRTAAKIAEVVGRKLAESEDVKASGAIINTPWQFVDDDALLKQAIEAFRADHERTYAGSAVSIVKLAKSGGCVSRDKAFRRHQQNAKIKEYFYGTAKFPLSPYSNSVGFNEVTVRMVGEGTLAPSSALPIGMERKVQETRVVKVEAGDMLLHSVLAVSNADRLDAMAGALVSAPALTADEETALILDRSVAGFVYVSEVDETKHKMTVLSPHPGRLPKKYLVMGSLKWLEM